MGYAPDRGVLPPFLFIREYLNALSDEERAMVVHIRDCDDCRRVKDQEFRRSCMEVARIAQEMKQ